MIKYKGSAKIVIEEDNKYVVKTKKNDLKELYDYLTLKGFDSFPKVIDSDENKVRYEYIESVYSTEDEIGKELIKTVADLHFRTTYFKDVSRKKYKEIHYKIINNIDYLKDYYEKLILKIDKKEYMSPYEYLIARNYSIIMSALMYAEREINSWYKLVQNKEAERVCVIHNNLRTSHFIRSDKGYLLNWDYSVVDTPVLDLYKFYKREYNVYNFKSLLKEYNNNFSLNEEEIKLFCVLISIPDKIEVKGNVINSVRNAKKIIDYVYITNSLVTSGVFKVESNKT